MHKGFEQIAQSIDRVRMISIQSDDNIACSPRESALVGPSIAAVQFGNNLRTHLMGNGCGAIDRTIVYHDYFIHKRRHFAQYFSNAGFFIEARYDYGDATILIHFKRSVRPYAVTVARSVWDRYTSIFLQ